MKTQEEGVIAILNKEALVGLVRKDPFSHKNVFYRCEEMGFEDIRGMFKGEEKVTNLN